MAIKSSNQITFTEQRKIVEIKEWYLATNQNTGVTRDTNGWTEDVQTIDYTKSYLWNWEEVVYSIGDSDKSEPVIISSYGKGISNIVNYYQVTQNLVAPELPKVDEESSWSDDVSVVKNLSPTNKYLWNYEAIIYTDGAVTTTDPAIIGVYGDSGADAITFEIYSVHGFMFKEDLKSIDLRIAAFEGGEAITNATYTWEWWNDELNDGDGGYSVIVKDSADQIFNVKMSDEYAFANLKCTMKYNGKIYEDYVVLTIETVIYTSVVKFFDGSNIFYSDDLYLVAYIELYQNNHKVETIYADTYCSGVSSVDSSGNITANLDGTFAEGSKMYFICRDGELYKAILGEYTSSGWEQVNYSTQYEYENTLYPNYPKNTNVIAISKESINKSQNIDFNVYKNGSCISNTNTNVIDSNDPIISDSAPSDPVCGQLWLDTSITPNVLKIFNELGEWTDCTNKIGGAIFTSKPSSYSTGDLWILADGEVCGSFGPGSMLKATVTSKIFNASHWIDADAATTELKSNILQTFTFNPGNNPNKGLPGLTIGQKDNAFYTNINSTEMGFYDNSKGQNQKVVVISNNSAKIKNLTVEESANFNCNATFNSEVNFFGFVWKKESNGSFSLAIAN